VLSLLDVDGSRGSSKISFMDAWEDGGTRSYQGMLLSLNKRMSSNYSMSANYTWSHCIGTATNVLLNGRAGGDVINDPNNRRGDRGNCTTNGQDIRHLVNGTAVFRMPQFSSTWVQRIVGNWSLSGILRARSGMHLTPVISADRDMTGQNVTQQRTDLLSTNVQGNQCTSDLRASNPTCRWFNASAFALPAEGCPRHGWCGNPRRSGKLDDRSGPVPKLQRPRGARLEFRAEATNALNHTNLGNPITNFSASTFGQILSAADARVLQFAVKYGF
jgi:hypothetical protein